MEQNEITYNIDLVDIHGDLVEPGFARKPLWRYNREDLTVKRVRMKEWDYYLVNTGKIAIAFTMSDLGYMRMASVSFLDLEKGTDTTKTWLKAPAKDYIMPKSPKAGTSIFETKGFSLSYESTETEKHIVCEAKDFYKGSDFKADLTFNNLPEESMNILTPWEDRKHFYLNEKLNCMPVEGKVVYNWHVYRFNEKEHCGVLDWGRGYWPYKSRWFWGTASAMIDGIPFGFNLGYGFGDLSAASENVLFYKGKVHKLDQIRFDIPENPMEPWQIISSDGRFEAVFTPCLDRKADIDLKLIHSDQHQYFGFVDGTAILDNGKEFIMKHLPAAFEDIKNKY